LIAASSSICRNDWINPNAVKTANLQIMILGLSRQRRDGQACAIC
jgi:hypothetical protein